MWFITLLVLALAAYFIIKAISASSKRKELEQQQTPEITTDQSSPPAQSLDSASPGNEVAAPPPSAGNSPATASPTVVEGLNTGDTLKDAQEMIKILNLAGPDAGRLGINAEQFQAIRNGDSATLPGDDQMQAVSDKLRNMLA